ncbi:MAG: chemotaxis response regulator protein-glutamate methylesterase [Chloroflexi bacterium]|nr:chemotaxis response regulator protein-glutamate methylesterase [Chloroflexota bacterium]
MINRIRTLIVDDSAYMRFAIGRQLSSDDQIEVVGTARDGMDAVDKVRQLRPDVVTLDVEMPRMDGLAALSAIMDEAPLPIVMVSSLTQQGADVTIRALTAGAIDFVTKPANGSPVEINRLRDELVAKVKASAHVRPARPRKPLAAPAVAAPKQAVHAEKRQDFRHVVIIGSSTGGPRALYEVVPQLQADIPAAIVIVQHMPEGFTKSLAQRLDEASQIEVREAAPDHHLATGLALVAPGDSHLLFDSAGKVQLSRGPRIHGVRPAVDVTMESLARSYGNACIGVVLTGMGSDGTTGAAIIKSAGGRVIAEHESTCVVYGMPRSVIEKGCADEVVPLPVVARRIAELV